MSIGTSTIVVIYLFKAVVLTFLYKVVYRRWKNRKGNLKKNEAIDISLEDLSGIWLCYNEDLDSVELAAKMDANKKHTEAISGLYGSDEESNPSDVDTSDEGNTVDRVKKNQADENENIQEVAVFSAGKVKTKSLSAFVKDMSPYFNEFEKQNAFELFVDLVKELDTHSDCPSIVISNDDQESVDLYSVRDNLRKITLVDHTVRVAREMLIAAGNTYVGYIEKIPQVTVIALAHDIGKIPERYDTGGYNTHEHASISASRLLELYKKVGKEILWFPDAERAIRGHHLPSSSTKDQLTSILKVADKEARKGELHGFTSQFKEISTEEWFDVEKFIEKIAYSVNDLRNGKWKAFSFRGLVYCRSELVYKIAKKMCAEAKALDLTFVYESEEENALHRIVGILKDKDYVADVLLPGRSIVMISIKSPTGHRKFNVVPLRGDRFKDYGQLESKKFGYLESIKEVRIG